MQAPLSLLEFRTGRRLRYDLLILGADSVGWGGGEALAVGHHTVDGVGCGLGGVDLHRIHFSAVNVTSAPRSQTRKDKSKKTDARIGFDVRSHSRLSL
jgi:hypothetical protein